MKRSFLLLCCALTLTWGASSAFAKDAPGQKKLIIGISTPSADHGWTGGVVWWSQQAVQKFGEKYPNIEFIYKHSDSEKEQTTHIDAFLEKGINALVILPHKPAPLTTVLNKAHNAGVFVVVVDRSIPKVPKDVYLSGDNYGFGHESGVYMARELNGKGNILVMEGIPCEGNTSRVNGFKDGIKDTPGIAVMDSQPAYWSPPKGYELMKIYLRQFDKIDAIWCGDDDVLEGALKAYQESGRTDVKFMIGGGGSKRIIKMIRDGDAMVRATVTYPPEMVYKGVDIAVQHLTEGKDFEKEIIIPSILITKENAQEHYYPDSVY